MSNSIPSPSDRKTSLSHNERETALYTAIIRSILERASQTIESRIGYIAKIDEDLEEFNSSVSERKKNLKWLYKMPDRALHDQYHQSMLLLDALWSDAIIALRDLENLSGEDHHHGNIRYSEILEEIQYHDLLLEKIEDMGKVPRGIHTHL